LAAYNRGRETMQEVKDITIINAKYIKDYMIEITFSNHVIKIINLQDAIAKLAKTNELYAALLDKDYFKAFKVEYGALVWNDNLDFAPEYLYEAGQAITKAMAVQSVYTAGSSKASFKAGEKGTLYIKTLDGKVRNSAAVSSGKKPSTAKRKK
jgi:hypothetical protein